MKIGGYSNFYKVLSKKIKKTGGFFKKKKSKNECSMVTEVKKEKKSDVIFVEIRK